MPSPESVLVPIPIVDVRDGGPVRHALECRERARALREEALGWFPRSLLPLTPALDRLARQWLTHSHAPYVPDIAAIAAALGFPGIWFLNNSYQWCCTALARDEADGPWLARTLDWPCDGLGRHVEVARMRGPAGEFFNVTWPGFVGVLTALAPGRFGAAINQAPLRRRTRHRLLRPVDLAANAVQTWFNVRHMPPDHLLRLAFETCPSYGEARRLLERVPVARPVIFTLVGCAPGERCLIERIEEGFATHEDTVAANDWRRSDPGWEARVGGEILLSATFEQAATNSRVRREALAEWSGRFPTSAFEWVAAPVLNPYTRVAVEMCPHQGSLRVVGYERAARGELPVPVTRVCEVADDGRQTTEDGLIYA
ncbi:MAG: hypothetical protein JO328_04785 [Hyphomicrobiales bacterium]|nr:hypothetical protein [Hyphomicrobiales bacterium]MBV9428129.1 hypothetical protein [Bradyrhizobiaceae bacterium]